MSTTARKRIAYLDGIRLNRALRAGVARLIADRIHLNRINVFPVPDGDTGTNMAMTCGAIAQVLIGSDESHAGRLLTMIADAALDGARGNSGAILAQFFQGLADSAGDESRLDAAALSKAFTLADDYARIALGEPLEGTVLTVITDVADAMREQIAGGEDDVAAVFDAVLTRAETSLENTRNGLEAMRKANVVDAGASGFVDLLAGIADFLHRGSLRDVPEPAADDPDIVAEMVAGEPAGDSEYRFCTECMVSGERLDRRRIREALSPLGNSMVLAGTARKLRVHIHSNDPEQIFDTLAIHGEVSATKADDMHQQTRSVGRSAAKVVVVTDSAADLPEIAYETYGIHVVPLRISLGDRSYLDKISLTAEEFFALLRDSNEAPQTSQPAPGDFRRTFEFLASHFEHVIAVSLSAAVSGTCQAATAAAKRVSGPGDITVIDSRNVSLGQGLIALRAAELAQQGIEAAEIVARIGRTLEHTESYGIVDDLSFAVRGGRLSDRRRRIADLLRIRPIFRINNRGGVSPAGAILRSADRVAKLARFIARRTQRGTRYRIAIGHGNCIGDAERLRELLAASVDTPEQIMITEIGATLGSHTGPGTLAAAVQDFSSD